MRRLPLLLSLVLVCLFAAPAQAAPDDICFPQVPDCIKGRFAAYWRDNGGLSVFGMPLTPSDKQRVNPDDKITYLVQQFERARFELHPKEPKPYDVLLGRIGADRLAALGIDWQTLPKADPATPHYFAETGHAVAPQFWRFYSTHGLEFDSNKKATSLPEAIALFGLPISEAQMEPAADGNMYLTQWYERARFEYHPENQAPYDVLLGRLGAETLDLAAASSEPQGLPGIPAPTGGCIVNAPPPAEGAQAWLTDLAPATIAQFDSICVRLIVNGAVVSGAEVNAVAHYHRRDQSYGPATTGSDGVAEIGFNIGDEQQALRRVEVPVDVTISAPDGQQYTARTSFLPNYPKNP